MLCPLVILQKVFRPHHYTMVCFEHFSPVVCCEAGVLVPLIGMLSPLHFQECRISDESTTTMSTTTSSRSVGMIENTFEFRLKTGYQWLNVEMIVTYTPVP